MHELKGIDEAFFAGLKALDPAYNEPNRLSARVTVWMPDHNGQWLICTDLRHHCHGIPRLVGRSNTKHWFSPPRGPIGSAFATNEIQISIGLPDPRSHLDDYVSRVIREWGVEEHAVRSFNRHARAFVGIPICFKPTQPEIAVCIDVEDSLDQVNEGQLVELCTDIRKKTEEVLAALWMLRMKA